MLSFDRLISWYNTWDYMTFWDYGTKSNCSKMCLQLKLLPFSSWKIGLHYIMTVTFLFSYRVTENILKKSSRVYFSFGLTVFLAHFFYPKSNNQNLMSCSKFLKRYLQLFFTAKLICWSEEIKLFSKSFNHFFCSRFSKISEISLLTSSSSYAFFFFSLYILCYTTFKILSNHFIYKPYSWKTLNRCRTVQLML